MRISADLASHWQTGSAVDSVRRHCPGRVPAALLLVACFGLAGSSCSSHSAAAKTPVAHHVVARVLPAPSGLIAAGAPQPNGLLWVLNSGASVKTLTSVDLIDAKTLDSVGVSTSASALAQSSTGILALGLATARTGAVELLNATTGAEDGAIAVGAPVLGLAFGGDGVTLYVLDGDAASTSVTVIDTTSSTIVTSFGQPHDAIGLVPDPSQSAIWTVDRSGVIEETSLSSGKPVAAFALGDSGLAIAMSPNSDHIYVLKGTPAASTIAVVSTVTDSVERLIPAAAGSIALAVSPDGRTLYDMVGTPTVGNIQEIPLGPSGG